MFFAAQGGAALETVAWAAAWCVGYQEDFISGDRNQGAYVCRIHIAAPVIQMLAGGPGGYAAPAAGEPADQQQAGAPVLERVVVTATVIEKLAPSAGQLLTAAAKALAEAALSAAAALPVAMTLGLILLSSTPAGGPGIDQHLPPPLSPDALRLIELEEARKHQVLTDDEVAELIALLAKVRGVHVTGPQELEYRYSQDIAFNHWWDQHAPADLRQLDLQSTLDHVMDRDFGVDRAKGIGGAHDKTAWDKHKKDYVEISRKSHPTTPGVELVTYQIPAVTREGKPTGKLKAKVYEKNLYDPQVWPMPPLERALKQAISNSYRTNNNALPREWNGFTDEGYLIHGFYDPATKKVTSFFFK